ncbi:cellulose binding domain-containing protein [Cellulomonas wangsupingiae]|uniref:cellulose binding domain-containing protein n=1 Tax=Cellulomonas wangsupingiae TaxID=2968085 RepID=UPI001D0EF7F6|nr:cellulose binding domain-containing protein [Cellulomonas wangsupingiae]MCM0638788.1 cellulose-binding domain-containing protein [Cellulomonas wangsupingiae]
MPHVTARARGARLSLVTLALALAVAVGVPTSASSVAPTAPAPSPATSTLPTPRPAGACQATYRTIASWPGGYVAEVTVFSSNAISAWSVTWSTGGGTVQQVWGGTLTSPFAVVQNAAWNGDVPAGGTATFGVYGTGPTVTPFVTCTA